MSYLIADKVHKYISAELQPWTGARGLGRSPERINGMWKVDGSASY